MTERSILFATTGAGDGTASGYTSADLFELFRSLFTGATGGDYSGIAPDYLDGLAVTGSSSPLSVATGSALVYGVPYFNTAVVSVAIPTPTTATRIDRIVLRASWAAQTVRVYRIAGTEGGGAPALTTSAGVTWDCPLATVTITTGAVITIADTREFLRAVGDLGITTAKLAGLAVTTAKLADGAVTSAKIADATIVAGDLASDSVTTAKILDANVTTAKLADSAVATGKIADNAVATAKIADGAATNAKLADMAQATVKGRASGAGTGDPVDLTPAQVVAIITSADGAGTGLDADTLDGSHATAFAAAAHTHGTTEIADNATTNAKLADMAQATVKGRASGAGTGDPVDLTPAQVVAIITGGDGAGSGLDADLLDGSHATAFAAAAHTHGGSEILDGSITNTELAWMGDSTIKGRASGAGSGAPGDLSAAQVATIVMGANVFAQKPSAWTTLTLAAGVTAAAGLTPKYRLNGDVVEFKGAVTSSSSGTVIVCDIPALNQPHAGESHNFCHVTTTQAVALMQAYNIGGISRIIIYDFVANTDYDLSAIRYSVTA